MVRSKPKQVEPVSKKKQTEKQVDLNENFDEESDDNLENNPKKT